MARINDITPDDTLATSLEAPPVAVAQKHLAPHGWTPGKHTSSTS